MSNPRLAGMLDFLTAQLDEDANRASIISPGGYAPQTWHAEDDPARARWMPIHAEDHMIGDPPDAGERDPEPFALVANRRGQWAHVVRWDPASVLADIESKRRIIALHHPVDVTSFDRDGEERSSDVCFDCDDLHPCETLRLIAYAYRLRPGYREWWAPEEPAPVNGP